MFNFSFFNCSFSGIMGNPWSLKNVRDYLFYCCAECDFKDKSASAFLNHATMYHPNARKVFGDPIKEDNDLDHGTFAHSKAFF